MTENGASAGRPQGLKPDLLGGQTARLKPRPFKSAEDLFCELAEHNAGKGDSVEARSLKPAVLSQSPAASTAGISSATLFAATFALVTRMTDATMIALPIRM
jgi:hypothetical protein